MGQGDGSLGGVPDLRREEYKGHDDPVPTAARTRNTDRPATEGSRRVYQSTTSTGGLSFFLFWQVKNRELLERAYFSLGILL